MCRHMQTVAALIAVTSWAGSGYAEPVISTLSGSAAHGGQLTIVGASFGAKTQAPPLRWDDFQDGTPDQWLVDRDQPGGGVWDLQAPGPAPYTYDRWPQYSIRRQRYPGDITALQAFHHADDPAANAEYTSANRSIAVIDEPSRVWYVSMWVYQDDYAGNALYTDNAKLYGNFCLGHWCDGPNGLPAVYWVEHWYGIPIHGYDSGSVSHHWSISSSESVSIPRPFGHPYVDNRGRWVRIEMFLDVGDTGQSNSMFMGYSELQPRFGNDNLNLPTDMQDIGTLVVGFFFRPRMRDGSAGGDGLVTYAALDNYISELYVDHSFARVEIGDAPLWSECTHREIQIPSTWNSNEIQITNNIPTLSTGSQAYLFVIDENRHPSQGYPIVIGQSYSHEDPGPPGSPGTVGFTPLPQ
jgi:hypothetical protein